MAEFGHQPSSSVFFERLPLRLTRSFSVVQALGAFRDRRKKNHIPVPSFILTGAPNQRYC